MASAAGSADGREPAGGPAAGHRAARDPQDLRHRRGHRARAVERRRPAGRARRLRGRHGRVGLGQVDADEHHRLPGRPDPGPLPARRASTPAGSRRAAAGDHPQPQDRLRLPVVQPDPAHRRRWSNVELPLAYAGVKGRRAARAGAGRAGPGRAGRPGRAPAVRAVRRAAAAGRDRPGDRHRTRCCCWPTSRPARWTAAAPPRCSPCSTSSTLAGRTVVVITHEDEVAAHAKRVCGCGTARSSPTSGRPRWPTRRRAGPARRTARRPWHEAAAERCGSPSAGSPANKLRSRPDHPRAS